MTVRQQCALSAVLVLFLSAAAGSSYAADYYVDGINGVRGDPGTEAKPFADIDECAAIMVAGDTCFIKNGTYSKGVDVCNGHASGNPVCYKPINSGSAGNPITFTNYPGHKPLLYDDGSDGATWIIGFKDPRHHITYSGLVIQGCLRLEGDKGGTYHSNVIVEKNEFLGGGGKDDGNWSALFTTAGRDLIIRDNYFHHVGIVPYARKQVESAAKAITAYYGEDILIENNLFRKDGSVGYIKGRPLERVTIRRNIAEVEGEARGLAFRAEHTDIYENIFICDGDQTGVNARGGSGETHPPPNHYRIYNNTFHNCSSAIYLHAPEHPGIEGGAIYNNIMSFPAGNRTIFTVSRTDDHEPDYMDHNFYSPQLNFVEHEFAGGIEWHGLAAQAGNLHPGDYDDNSVEGDPLFIDPASGDFRLQANSPAKGVGKNGEDLGAYPRADGTVIGPRDELDLVVDPLVGPPGKPVLVN